MHRAALRWVQAGARRRGQVITSRHSPPAPTAPARRFPQEYRALDMPLSKRPNCSGAQAAWQYRSFADHERCRRAGRDRAARTRHYGREPAQRRGLYEPLAQNTRPISPRQDPDGSLSRCDPPRDEASHADRLPRHAEAFFRRVLSDPPAYNIPNRGSARVLARPRVTSL